MDYECTGYRIVEYKNGKVYSLFHGTNKSREIKLDQWNPCDKKLVQDGSHGQTYNSGWHFLPTENLAISFFNRMFRVKENRRIVKCYLRGNIRRKDHSTKGRCFLADEILIKSEDL